VGRYRLVLEPPDDRDYDLQLYENRSPCPGPLVWTLRASGDETEDRPFDVEVDGAVFFVRVYPADADQVDIHQTYTLQLSYAGGPTGTPEPTLTPTFTPAPTSTATPTLSVRVP
jgi:hypothetical protein